MRAYIGLCLPLSVLAVDFCSSVVDSGTFASPASHHRAPFRYWLPDASVDKDVVSKDIALNKHVGAGGLEFVPFFEYGGQLGKMPQGADWSTYGFGTQPFRELFIEALNNHFDHGLPMDFALGPNQGQGVPADPRNPGLQWDLVRTRRHPSTVVQRKRTNPNILDTSHNRSSKGWPVRSGPSWMGQRRPNLIDISPCYFKLHRHSRCPWALTVCKL